MQPSIVQAKTTKTPCETERLFWARRIVRAPGTSPEDMDRAEAILRASRDWIDLDLAKKLREARIAAARIARAEAQRQAHETLALPLEPQTAASRAEDQRALRWLIPCGIALLAGMLALVIYSPADASIAATSAQVAEWRSWR